MQIGLRLNQLRRAAAGWPGDTSVRAGRRSTVTPHDRAALGAFSRYGARSSRSPGTKKEQDFDPPKSRASVGAAAKGCDHTFIALPLVAVDRRLAAQGRKPVGLPTQTGPAP